MHHLRIEARPHNFGQTIEVRFLMGETYDKLEGVGILALNPLQWHLLKLLINIGFNAAGRSIRTEIMDGTDKKPTKVN